MLFANWPLDPDDATLAAHYRVALEAIFDIPVDDPNAIYVAQILAGIALGLADKATGADEP